MINITYSNLQNQAKEKLSLLTDDTEKEIMLDNMPVEAAVDALGNLVIATFSTESASLDPNTYLPNYLNSISLPVKELTQNVKGVVGAYVYPNKEIYNGIYDVWYLVEDGKYVKTNKQETADMFYPTNDSMTWYYTPIINKKALWTHVYFDEILKENCISYVKPIIIQNIVVGMAGIDASFTVKKNTIEGIQIYKTGFAFLLDDKQQFIVSPKTGVTIALKDINTIYQKLNLKSKDIIETPEYYMNFVRMNNNQILVIAAPKKEVTEPINQIIIWIILSTIGITITVMFIGYIVSKSIVDPLEKLKEFANNLGNGNMEDPVVVKSNDEVGNLADSFEKLRVSILNQNKILAKYGEDLEQKVKERTKDLEEKNIDLEKMNKITIDRELKMIELKNTIKNLELKLAEK
jgi:methyl-accepting chemotaxis protein